MWSPSAEIVSMGFLSSAHAARFASEQVGTDRDDTELVARS
jgi:hypothetical protein